MRAVGGKFGPPGPVYSLEKLFTEKELQLTHNTAALAAHKHILTHHVGKDGQVTESPSDSTEASHQEENDENLAAPMMERHHSTRSTRGGHANHHANFVDDKILGLETLTSFDLPANLEKISTHEPKLPPLNGQHYAKGYGKTADSNSPPSLMNEDINQDLALINMYKQYENIHGSGSVFQVENGGRKVLQSCITPLQDGRFVSYHQGQRPDGEAVRKELGLPTNGSSKDDGSGGVATPQKDAEREKEKAGGLTPGHAPTTMPMSRQSSVGGVVMSRQGSGKGKRRA